MRSVRSATTPSGSPLFQAARIIPKRAGKACQPHQEIHRKIHGRTMTEPETNPDRKDNLLQPVAKEPDPRDRALLEETLAAVRELCDLLRESATDPEDKILPALRQLESRLEALPEALRGTIRQAVDDCLAAGAQETRKTKPSGDASIGEGDCREPDRDRDLPVRAQSPEEPRQPRRIDMPAIRRGRKTRRKRSLTRSREIHPALRSHRQPGLQAHYVHLREPVAAAHQFVPDLDADSGCCRDADRIRIPADPAIAEFAMRRMSACARPAGQPWYPRPA